MIAKIILLITTVSLALADIGIKTFIESNFKRGEEKSILNGKVQIRKVYNQGMALNVMDDKPETVKEISCLMCVVLFFYYIVILFRKGHLVEKIALSFMNAGAWSNTYDRWLRGYVIDYVGFKTKSENFNRVTFNIGDFYIIFGSVLALISSILPSNRKENSNDS